jgi:hypothetical protein
VTFASFATHCLGGHAKELQKRQKPQPEGKPPGPSVHVGQTGQNAQVPGSWQNGSEAAKVLSVIDWHVVEQIKESPRASRVSLALPTGKAAAKAEACMQADWKPYGVCL